MQFIQPNEEYKCIPCNRRFSFIEANQNWKCPSCFNPISIKFSIDNFFHNCHRLHPNELKVGELVTLEGINIHEILNIKINGNVFTLALKQYKAVKFGADDFILMINGAWS